MANKTFATNKRASYDYLLLSKYVAGIVLTGQEVKSIRLGNASLKGAYVTISADNEAWLTNSYVKKYQHANGNLPYDPERPRKLLLNKNEIAKLRRAKNDKLILVPISFHAAGAHIKLALAIGKPKKKYDKREAIKSRDTTRDIKRNLKT